MIVLDTSVLSLVLRRRRQVTEPIVDTFAAMVQENVTLGVPAIVVQEILSGVRYEEQFVALEDRLRAFPIMVATLADHLQAGRLANQCRSAGIAAASIDVLITAMTIRADGALFTLDQDFYRIAAVVPLKLFRADSEPRR